MNPANTKEIEGFPGGSKSRVNKAGERVRVEAETADDIRIIDEWRAAHRAVLNTFQAILRSRTRRSRITVAQRHKRKRTIFDKLKRFQSMQLSRMDDVAGCRLIFSNIAALRQFRTNFHEARFNHRRRNEVDKYDYIKRPKKTGYRGIHDVYEYDVRSSHGLGLKGLYVEIQYRTLVQHAWATAVEIVGFITESQPKFQKGDQRYTDVMALASEILARAHENERGPFPEMGDLELVNQFTKAEKDLALLKTLRGIKAANQIFSDKRNAILIFSETGDLKIHSYRDAPDALKALFEFEKSDPKADVVLVRADTSDEVRLAFKNYFSDTNDFLRLLDEGCHILSRHKETDKNVNQPNSK